MRVCVCVRVMVQCDLTDNVRYIYIYIYDGAVYIFVSDKNVLKLRPTSELCSFVKFGVR